jgi:hypothetical protein
MSYSIISRNVTIQQKPSEDNYFHAICYVTVCTSTGHSTVAIGESKGHSWDDVHGLLQQAEQNGYEKAVAFVENSIPPERNYPSWNAKPQHPFSGQRNLSSTNGGGNKPVSEKQMNLIKSLCNKHSINSDEYMTKKFNMSLEMLNGSQANQIINELKNIA